MVRPLTREPGTRAPDQDDDLISDADERQILLALEGLSFPASRHVVTAYATDRGGVSTRVLTALDHLPEAVFSSAEDVVIRLPARLAPSRARAN